jgi:hypothetical protein
MALHQSKRSVTLQGEKDEKEDEQRPGKEEHWLRRVAIATATHFVQSNHQANQQHVLGFVTVHFASHTASILCKNKKC